METNQTNQFVKAMVEYLASENQRYLDHEAQIILDAMNSNDGHRPTKDKHGRLHAPFSGYVWQGEAYGPGEYLSDDFLRNACSDSAKLKMQAKDANSISEQITAMDMCYIKSSTGKTWTDYRTKSETCYLYVKGLTLSTVNELVERATKQQKLLQQEQDKASDKQLERFSFFDDGTARPEIKEGRQFVTGVIDSLKYGKSESMYYVHYNQKMRILTDEGTFITGTVPDQYYDMLVVGDRVTVKGTVTKSKNNPSFGYYGRPSNFQLLACSVDRENTLDLQRVCDGV